MEVCRIRKTWYQAPVISNNSSLQTFEISHNSLGIVFSDIAITADIYVGRMVSMHLLRKPLFNYTIALLSRNRRVILATALQTYLMNCMQTHGSLPWPYISSHKTPLPLLWIISLLSTNVLLYGLYSSGINKDPTWTDAFQMEARRFMIMSYLRASIARSPWPPGPPSLLWVSPHSWYTWWTLPFLPFCEHAYLSWK